MRTLSKESTQVKHQTPVFEMKENDRLQGQSKAEGISETKNDDKQTENMKCTVMNEIN